METIPIIILNLGLVTAMMVIGWLISVKVHNVTHVDSLWGMGFVLIAWLAYTLGLEKTPRGVLLVFLTTLWGVRLSLHLSWRNWGKGEDPRYGAWRRKHGKNFPKRSLYSVFLVQALFLWAIAGSLQYGILAGNPYGFTRWDLLGIVVWCTGFVFETVGDFQLARFKADLVNKGQVMDRGLWAYTRHPNYFGETLIWWGVYLMVVSTPGGIWTVFSPLVITIVLLKMTGVTLTEKSIVEKRPHYRNYIERTSMFIPWFPKKRP